MVLPNNFESTDAHTLVIALHGYGATAENFLKYSKLFIEAGFIYAAPEALYPYFGKNGNPGYEWFLYDISSSTMPERPASNLEKAAMRVTSEKQMGQIISDLNEKYKVDKIYLMGFAQGGPIAYLTGIHHYNKINGILLINSKTYPK